MEKKYIVALYLRISKEDAFFVQGIESNSISNQRILLKNFVQNHSELSHSTILEVIDDGYSGVHFNRPGIVALLEMAQKREVDCIVVKDFSRFGRNYLEVGRYLEQVFPRLGIRFLSVNDQFDSFCEIGAAGSVEVGFRNILYEAYSKDLSIKVRSARRVRAEQGKFVTGFAPFGYRKGENHNLVLDPEYAPIVQKIFHLFCQGIKQKKIANQLNLEGVLCPGMVRKKRGELFGRLQEKEIYIWKASTISHILSDQRYLGTLNAQTAIITREQFELAMAQKRHYKKRKYRYKKEEILQKEWKNGILIWLQILNTIEGDLFLEKENKKIQKIRELYEKYKRGKLKREEFQKAKNRIKFERKYLPLQILTKEMIDGLIESVFLETDGIITICWRFINPIIYP